MPCPFSYFCQAKKDLEMKVICFGAPHAGNDSLPTALNKIYKNPIYGIHNALTGCQMCRWKKLLDKKHPSDGKVERKAITSDELKSLFKGYCAVTVSPHIFFIEEMIKSYPNAKIIVTKIDVNEWLKNAGEISLSKEVWTDQGFLMRIARYLSGFTKRMYFVRELMQRVYGIDVTKDEELIKFYNDHYATLDKLIPKDKRLDFNEKDGWNPLCKFLDVPVPQEAYPDPDSCKCPMRRKDKCFGLIVKVGIPLAIVAVAVTAGVIISKKP